MYCDGQVFYESDVNLILVSNFLLLFQDKESSMSQIHSPEMGTLIKCLVELVDLVHLLITCTPSPSIQLDVTNISVFVGWLETVDTHGPMNLWLLRSFKPFELLKNCIECGTKMTIQPYWIWILPQHHQNVMVSYEIIGLC